MSVGVIGTTGYPIAEYDTRKTERNVLGRKLCKTSGRSGTGNRTDFNSHFAWL